jgi:hypothetical protein
VAWFTVGVLSVSQAAGFVSVMELPDSVVIPPHKRAECRAHPLRSSELTISPMIPGELITDYRVRLALEQAHADERRQTELLELSATTNAPQARIRAWERTHGLTLPRASTHPVLNSVAAATRLTLEQVQDEQRRRLMPASTP